MSRISPLSRNFKPGKPMPDIDRKRVEIQQSRIDACDTLLDYLHDDVPWKDQQPMMDMLRQLRSDFEDQLFEGTHPDE